ncbi:hypothetical protein SK069_19125, partial [Patulibacter brassicae]|nr:hypothetical protein [Patulibacter brassicae]
MGSPLMAGGASTARSLSLPAPPRVVVEIGGMFHLAWMVLVRSLRPPFSYGPEFVAQFRFAVQIAIV